MRRPERSPTEGILTFAVTSGSCIAVLSAHPDGRRVVGGTDRSPLWFRPSPGLGDTEQKNSPTRCGTRWRNQVVSAKLPVGRLWGKCYLFAPDCHCPICRIEFADHERY